MTGPINPNVSGDTETPSSNAYITGTATIGTTAAVLVTVPGGYSGGVVVTNTHATNVLYVGGSNVSTANGVKVAANGGVVTVPSASGRARALYAVASGAGTTVNYLLPG